MKKSYFFKFFVFALVGALAILPSCKDYDDDISRLDTDLTALKNSAAGQSELTALQSQLTTSISSVQADLNTAITDLAALQAISGSKADIAEAKEEILALAVKLETFNTYKAWVDGEIATLKADLAKASTKEEVLALEALLNSELASTRVDLSLTIANLEALTEVVEGNSDAIADVKSELDEQLAEIKANAAEIAVIKTDLKEKIEALTVEIEGVKALIETMQGDLNTISVALEEAEARLDLIDTEIETINTRIDELETAMGADLLSVNLKVNSMITEVSFDFVYDDYERYRWLEYSTTTEVVDFVFASGIKNPITFVEGQRLASQAQKILVKVSPANADLSKMTDKISLIRGDNNTEINNYLKAVKAERANPLLTRATPTVTGLWYVTFELSQTADLDDLRDLTYGEGVYLDDGVETDYEGNYLFAMAIENTVDVAEDAEARFIISDFVIQIDTDEDFDRANVLDFMVDETEVSDINNRAADGSLSLNENGITYEELVWTGNAQPTTTGNTSVGDDRSEKDVYPAVQGVPMTIKLTGDNTESIRAMYVTLDFKENAIESAPSEWNAWQSYSYSGLNTVVEGTETEIVINNASAINDIIGFRVFAVNYDGTLVDPDGKAFYVSLGVDGENWNTVNTVITPESETVAGIVSESVDKTLTEVTGATSFVWTTDEDAEGNTPAFHVVLEDADGELFRTDGGDVSSVDFKEVTKLHTVPTASSWLAYEDNKVYNGTLIVKNATGHVIATLKVSMKKVLPTDAPEGFSIKTNQLSSDGVYRAYLIPTQGDVTPNWTAPDATHGSMKLDQVFNFTGNALTAVANFDVIFADADRDEDDELINLVVTPGNETLIVAKEFIDNKTEHETSVVYNYGEISTELEEGENYVIEVENFPTIFSNIYNDTYSWNWATRAQLGLAESADLPYNTQIVYGTDVIVNLAHIYGVSSRDNIYNAPLSAPYLSSLELKDAKLYSKGTEIEEYFTAEIVDGKIELTEASGSTNPTANVPSTLVITMLDMYGHEVVIELPMTVLTRN
jgi:predicted  nucleic acid-binding Zn-ribbon protein